jgi:hypothetical protein
VVAVGLAVADDGKAPDGKTPPIDNSIPDIPIVPNLDPPAKPGDQPAKPPDKGPDSKTPPAAPNKDKKDAAGSNYNGGFGDGSTTSSPQRDKLLKQIEKQLAAMTPLGSKKREASDFYVLWLIEVTKKHKVTEEFLIVQGVKDAAVKVVDYLLHDPTAIHEWKAFARVKNMAAAKKQAALAKAKSVEAQVNAFPMGHKGAKRSSDDAFVVGTSQLRLSDKHADVRFYVLKGVRTVADFLLDYVLAAPGGVKRDWHVFYRTHSEDDANDYVDRLRKDYDDMETKREAIAKIYEAASTSRC